MRVVAYVRMSTGKQEHSPAQQRSAIAAHAKRQGYVIAKEYADLGVSGVKAEKRPQFRQMISDGSARKFDRIVVYDRSRFGRFDSVEFGRWVQPLREAGVDLETLDGGVEDWDDFGGRLKGMIEQEGKHAFVIDLSRATVRGQTSKAVEGRGYAGPTPFGYVRTTTITGRNRHSTLALDAIAAPVVRRIFETYAAAGSSLTSVAAALNDEGVPPPRRGERWRKNSVQRILENEVYMGDAVWGRRLKGLYHGRSGTEVVKRKRGAGIVFIEPIRHLDAVPAVVDRETFARVQRLMRERGGQTRSPAKIRTLSGLLFCAGCGKPMHADGAGLARCSSSSSDRGQGRPCSASRVPTAPVLDAVLEGLRARLAAPAERKRLEAALERRTAARATSGVDERATLVARHRALAAEVAAGLERIPSMPTSLLADYTATLDRKAAERDRTAAEIAATQSRRTARPTADIRAAMARIDDLLGDVFQTGSPAAANAALRALGVTVTMPPRKPLENALDAEITVGDSSTPYLHSGLVPYLPKLRWKTSIFVGKRASRDGSAA